MITVKIDLKKLDKKYIFQGRNGAEYIDLVLFENRDGPDQYGNDYVVKQSLPKEAREAGEKAAIVGNAKNMSGGAQRQPQPQNRPQQRPQSRGGYGDDRGY